jgi:Leucine-rich repeat (LRR) protein
MNLANMDFYISKFNSLRILKSINSYKEIDFNQFPYFPINMPFFNIKDEREASLYRLFLTNPQEFIEKYYMRIKDTMTYVYERPPAFHSSAKCPFLSSKFENIFIPKEIFERAKYDESLLKKFREWCIQHYDLFQRNRLAFIAQCCLEFNLHESAFRGIERHNMGVEGIIADNSNLNEIKNKIEKMISDFNLEINSSSLKMVVYREFKHKIFLGLPDKEITKQNTGFSNDEVKQVLSAWYNKYVFVGKPLVNDWLRIQLNKELSFQGNLLEQIGFLPCKSCCKDYKATVKVDFYSIDQVSQSSAITHKILNELQLRFDPLAWWQTLDDNMKIALYANLRCSEEIKEWGECLIDNRAILEDQIKIIKKLGIGAIKNLEGGTIKSILQLNLLLIIREFNLSNIIPIKELTNLRYLYLYYTQISDISPISMLTNLTDLDLSDTEISDIGSLTTLTNLINLSLRNTEISDISPLSTLTNLTRLDLCHTKISDISSLSMLTNLTDLDLSGNEISDISPLTTLTNLTDLDLSVTEILDISPLTALTNLTDLSLGYTKISNISSLSMLTNLTYLYLSGNEISDISPLSTLTNLTKLSLSHTEISDISPLTRLTNLTDLSLGYTKKSDITLLTRLTNLTDLSLSHTEISDISPLTALTNLTDLYLNGTEISDISPLSTLTNLTKLSLRNTEISDNQVLNFKIKLPNCDIFRLKNSLTPKY